MKFTTIPEAYSSFNSPLVYEFESEQEAKDLLVEITDLATNEVIGRKKLYAATAGSIDIAPYLRRRAIATLPENIAGCGIVEMGTQIKVRVTVDGTASSSRNFIAAKVAPDTHYRLLTHQLAQRTMARDEFDLIAYFAMPDAVVEVVVEAMGKSYGYLTLEHATGGQTAVAVTALDFDDGPEELKVTFKVDGYVEATVEYELKENLRGARRLAWLNESRSPELYTFPMRKSILIEAARRHIESVLGKEAAEVEHDGELKLLSAYEPQAQLEALAGIYKAERVWLVEGNAPRRIELRAKQVFTLPCDELGIIEVDICAAEEGVRL